MWSIQCGLITDFILDRWASGLSKASCWYIYLSPFYAKLSLLCSILLVSALIPNQFYQQLFRQKDIGQLQIAKLWVRIPLQIIFLNRQKLTLKKKWFLNCQLKELHFMNEWINEVLDTLTDFLTIHQKSNYFLEESSTDPYWTLVTHLQSTNQT